MYRAIQEFGPEIPTDTVDPVLIYGADKQNSREPLLLCVISLDTDSPGSFSWPRSGELASVRGLVARWCAGFFNRPESGNRFATGSSSDSVGWRDPGAVEGADFLYRLAAWFQRGSKLVL